MSTLLEPLLWNCLGIVANIKLLQSLGVGEELNTIITNCPGALSQESNRLEASFRTLWSLTSDKALVKRVIRKSPSLLRRYVLRLLLRAIRVLSALIITPLCQWFHSTWLPVADRMYWDRRKSCTVGVPGGIL